ncbi:tetratricopeptide repeat protein [Streptomyces sp. NBC_00878]|uniref:tetratricopeptide repeat protein n=1 Tax=Streptomyces sp. NBC_00878 TaxID=2975854 RepID=UPI00224C9B2A|nr:tetratricopeptide repeat protein [Streptomyces sp. NBC_00878]MCX4908339.1 tetratricopeptide repeat protein [Streptomyces sp. NBC_00878]
MLVGAVVGCAVLGGVLVAVPPGPDGPPPAPGPVARAMTAVGAGAPASPPDLHALIGDREAHLRAHPGDVRSWAVLGAAYAERGERTGEARYFPKAEKALRTSLRAKPKGNVEALDALAALANARHDFRTARKWGEASVAAAPKRWTAYPSLIDAYRGLGDYRAARHALARLVRLPSGGAAARARVLTRAALVYRDQGLREDAAAALWDAVALASAPAERADCLVRAGELAWEQGEPAEALRAFEEAVRADPDGHAALAGQGRALAALGRTSAASHAYRSASEKRALPQYAWELGELYESKGLGAKARGQYEATRARLREGAAGGVDSELVAGLFEADHGDPGSAVRRLRGEWERHPSVAVADALGWALHRAGKDEEALVLATKATDKEHGGEVRSAPYAYHRGMIERELELEGPARRHLEEALRISPYFSPLGVPAAKKALGALGSV